jgi:hypothetical protein
MIVPADRNVIVTGPTRCGKTEFMRWLMWMSPSFTDSRVPVCDLIVDHKREWKVRKSHGDRIAKSLPELARELNRAKGRPARILYHPPKEHLLRINASYLDEVAYLALERRFVRLYYDDVVIVANGSDFSTRAPNFFYALTLGNGQHVGVWMCAQRPAWIPQYALSETTYRGTFFLRKRGDRDTMEDLLGENLDQPPSIAAWDFLRRNRYTWVFGDDFETSPPTRLGLSAMKAAA